MIQVYTGDGKGKTTAALGLAIRAAGAGLKVYICQFLKGRYACELASLKKLKNIKIERFGKICFVRKTPQKEDFESARRALIAAKEAVCSRIYDMVILDEINVALRLKLLRPEDVLMLIKSASAKTELILTGRNAHQKILKAADLISEIRNKKHYYKKGVKARRGIEY